MQRRARRRLSALHWAAVHGDGQMAAMVMHAGANAPFIGHTLLHVASREGQTDVARLLVEGGAASAPRTVASPRYTSFRPDTGPRDALVDRGAELRSRKYLGANTADLCGGARSWAIHVLLECRPGAHLEDDRPREGRKLANVARERQRKVLAAFETIIGRRRAVEGAVQAGPGLLGELPEEEEEDTRVHDDHLQRGVDGTFACDSARTHRRGDRTGAPISSRVRQMVPLPIMPNSIWHWCWWSVALTPLWLRPSTE